MDRLAAMKVFVRVVETGSFSAIARENATTQSAVSKQVAALEATIWRQAAEPLDPRVVADGGGRKVLPRGAPPRCRFRGAEGALRWGQRQLTGWLRVAASVGYGRRILMPQVQSFLDLHPSLRIDLRLSDGFTDLIEQGIDVAVRIGDLPDSSFVARKIGLSERKLVAHRTYLDRFPGRVAALERPEDLTVSQLHRLHRGRDAKRLGVCRRGQCAGSCARLRQFAEQQLRGHPRRRARWDGHLLRPELAVSRRTRIGRDRDLAAGLARAAGSDPGGLPGSPALARQDRGVHRAS